MKDNIIVRTISRILIPFIQIYSLYVLAHGDLGPGGGFQGGVIIASSIILYVMVFGIEEGRKRVSEKTCDLLNPSGVLIYAGVGVAALLGGGVYLEYAALPIEPAHLASHLGIYGIEIGVFITVSAVMMTIFFETARHGDD
ncbi:MAG TPA: Na(+)/H(+) antiporter subunit B [Nitrospirota bacterium]|nr:Na(+)/H(+) antiporter subunit B [Nitrospirota bacterium]